MIISPKTIQKRGKMHYLWESAGCPNRHVAVYDQKQSPDRFFLRQGRVVAPAEFHRCYAYARSPLIDMEDDPFKYLTYKPGCMKNHKLARDEEYLGNILITEEIKEAFEKEKVKGAWLVRPEDYYSQI